MFYSSNTGGFYTAEIHGDNMPADAVHESEWDYTHAELLEGQSQGKLIKADNDGRPVLLDPPPPTTEQLIAQYRDAVQAHLDGAAKYAGYDDIKTAVTYAEEPAVPKFQAEGQAFRAWRSLCWAYAYGQLDAVDAGEREQPTIEQLISELPVLSIAGEP